MTGTLPVIPHFCLLPSHRAGCTMVATMWAWGGHQSVVTRSGRRLGAWWASLLVAVLLGVCVAVPASADEDEEGFINLALPAGGEVVVENRRGDVRVEV